MRAMVLDSIGKPLIERERPDPVPLPAELVVAVKACGVCRTDLHVFDGELPGVTVPRILGHEIVGEVLACGKAVSGFSRGDLVGIPWLAGTCRVCAYCRSGRENLCDSPVFTGYTRDGGYATHATVDADFAIHLPPGSDPVSTAPLLCAGLIGWRSLVATGGGKRLGLYGFGAAAHIIAQIAVAQGRDVAAFTKPGDVDAQNLARKLGCDWADGTDSTFPGSLDAAIIFAPAGELVPLALQAVAKGGRVVCAGIHMSDIPSFPYAYLWGERHVLSVANLTRDDAMQFFREIDRIPVRTEVSRYPLADANRALCDLRMGRIHGAAVLIP